MSALMKDCIARGEDVTVGGAHYNLLAPQATGQTNVGDSLAAVRKVVFEDRACTMATLLEALARNFDGHEKLHAQLQRAPKYGNDDDAADLLVREALRLFTDEVARHRNTRGGHYHAGAFPSLTHIAFGKVVGATPDGRKAGEPFATGVTPAAGRDVNGAAAVVNSAGKLDYLSASNGTVLTQWFHPAALADERGLRNLAAVVRSYFDRRGQEIQFNVTSADLLREAQKHPEQYRSLVVRVTGWSAFFVGLEKEVQDEIIARTAHCEV
jgi:formate C-acetyltransferase